MLEGWKRECVLGERMGTWPQHEATSSLAHYGCKSVKMCWNAAHGICQHLFAYYHSLPLTICPMNGKKVLVQTEDQAPLQIYFGHCRVNQSISPRPEKNSTHSRWVSQSLHWLWHQCFMYRVLETYDYYMETEIYKSKYLCHPPSPREENSKKRHSYILVLWQLTRIPCSQSDSHSMVG